MFKYMINRSVFVIIPVYNEAQVIGDVVKGVKKHFDEVICINDGSSDNSSSEINKAGATLIEHPINMGQGAALQTGIEYALQFPEAQYFITFDADGQHDIHDAQKMLKTLREKDLDVVLGSRFLGEVVNASMTKRVILKFAIKFTNRLSRVNLTDTHNGLRVFNRSFAEALDITMPGMAHASEIIDKMGRGNWKYAEMPVTISYSDYSLAKGQSMFNAINIVFDMFFHRISK
jgi:glycosyltransferase involved in cell wall biosynthesis